MPERYGHGKSHRNERRRILSPSSDHTTGYYAKVARYSSQLESAMCTDDKNPGGSGSGVLLCPMAANQGDDILSQVDRPAATGSLGLAGDPAHSAYPGYCLLYSKRSRVEVNIPSTDIKTFATKSRSGAVVVPANNRSNVCNQNSLVRGTGVAPVFPP
jgi:hypothetical protein